MAIQKSPGLPLDALAALAAGAPRKVVLVVEDDPSAGEALDLILGEAYEVRHAADGPPALALVRARPPAAVLLDLGLPTMDGFDVLGELKQLAPTVAVIVVTIFADIDTIVTAVKRGAADYVTKPWDEKNLLAKVRRALGETPLATSDPPADPFPAANVAFTRRWTMGETFTTPTIPSSQIALPGTAPARSSRPTRRPGASSC
ncbi:MAG: response regulator, partial [Candidatus Rokuibacteriota bacterium]